MNLTFAVCVMLKISNSIGYRQKSSDKGTGNREALATRFPCFGTALENSGEEVVELPPNKLFCREILSGLKREI